MIFNHVTCSLLVFIDKRSHASSEYQSHHIIFFFANVCCWIVPLTLFKFESDSNDEKHELSFLYHELVWRCGNWEYVIDWNLDWFSFSSFLTRTSEFYISVCENIFIIYDWSNNQFHTLISFTLAINNLDGYDIVCMYENNNSNLVDSASSIRLSQRLSHACLSINKSILWNCEWLIISVIVYLMVFATWITVVILELIHA